MFKNSLDDRSKNLIKGKQCCSVFFIVLKSSSVQVSGSGRSVGFCARPQFNTCSQTSISFICKSSLLIIEIKIFSESEVKLSDLNTFSGDFVIKSVQNC